ncbi:MAG: hypothetical protein KIT85_15100 [Pseudolabrys sp.]|nr:hypothetical protein [Pseudolabrys sp.]MCW5685730.1 hypothetical protein [Pseudolabrys sp.]
MTHIAYHGHHHSQRRKAKRLSPLLLPMIVFLGVTVGAVAFVTYVLWPRWPGQPVAQNAPALPVVIAGSNFNVEPAAVRRPVQRAPGVYDRIDLAYLWPSLLPPDPALKGTADNPINPNERIFVTIASGETSFPMSERVRTIYPRYLTETTTELPGGLTARAFRDGTSYQGEDLIVNDNLSFMARCSRRGIGNAGTCLSERRIGDADVTVRFPRDWLADTPALLAGIDRLFAKITPAPQ